MADTSAAVAFPEGHGPEHPLLVPAARAVCEVHPLMYDQPGHFAVGYYGGDDMNYHSELSIVQEYERVVCLDAARNHALVNMDDLFELDKGTTLPFGEALLGKNLSAELGAPFANATMSARDPGMPLGGVLVGKNRAARFAPREPGMPFGEALLGKNVAVELGAPYAYAPMSARDPGMPFGEALVGKNCSAWLDAPYSNAAMFVALRATPASQYAVQVSIDEAMGAKAGVPIAVGNKAAGADARDTRGRGGNLLAVMGIVAASSAVTAVAAGTVSPAVAFGFFVVLLGGLSLAVSTVRGV